MSGPAIMLRAEDIAAAGLAPPEKRDDLARVAQRYAVGLTPALARLIDPQDPADPIARQFVPDVAELDRRAEDLDDPIGDDAFSPVEGVVRRYPDRALLKLASVCKVYCRFCFRRESVGVGEAALLGPAALDAAFAYLASEPAIWEVILTGGDPLALSPRRLRAVMERLGRIEHVKIVRLHTRVPCADPAAIDAEMVAALQGSGKTVYLALHANHPRELTPPARAACARLARAGVTLVSQSVLLAGVNDDAETLAALMRGFVETGVKPYYLHHLDLAPGVSHFRVEIERGQALMRDLRGRLSGLCQPTYMLDIPGGAGKAPIGPGFIEKREAPGAYLVTDFRGGAHLYPPPIKTK
ncbi:lysine-2,3-aminomutase-like protein [Methylocella sp.]|uniref:lysine-2,3-aminomutase-like protein n=1 Tax=Methylocella sp. TaxID=1978226 RepID=UPI003783C42D